MIGKTVSHYRIVEKLGQGGMGVVYKAHDTHLDRPVALKFLPTGLSADPEFNERFIREARAASALDHSSICTIHDIEETDDGRMFICMALYDGESLAQRLQRGPLSWQEAVRIGLRVADGLACAHAAGIIHRDIKPENVMLMGREEIKILDFGLAKRSGEGSLTRRDSIIGTTGYMSPEQVRAEQVDARTDVWSLGVLLYEAISGVRPFRGPSEHVVLQSIQGDEPVELTQLTPGVPPALARIVQRCLAKRPRERQESMLEVLAELEAVDETRPAAGVQPLTPTRKLLLRSRGRRRLLAALALVLLVTVVWVAWPGNPAGTGDGAPRVMVLISPRQSEAAFGVRYLLVRHLREFEGVTLVGSPVLEDWQVAQMTLQDPGKLLEEHGVTAVIFGKVTESEDGDFSLEVSLRDTKTGETLYDKPDETERGGPQEICTLISEGVAEALRVEIEDDARQRTFKPVTGSRAAFQHLIRGRLAYAEKTPTSIAISIEHFEKAVAPGSGDQGFALAWAGLADAWRVIGAYDFPRKPDVDPFEKSLEYATKARQLDEGLAEAWASLAQTFFLTFRFKEAASHFEQAIKRNPNYPKAHQWYSRYLILFGDDSGSLAEARRAVELDPSPIGLTELGERHYQLGNYSEANETFKRVLEQKPGFFPAQLWKVLSLSVQARMSRATSPSSLSHPLLREAGRELGQIDKRWQMTPGFAAANGYFLAASGKKSNASGIVGKLESMRNMRLPNGETLPVPHYYTAAIYAGLGDSKLAQRELGHAWEKKEHWMTRLRMEPMFAGLRRRPWFQELLQKMGVPPSSP